MDSGIPIRGPVAAAPETSPPVRLRFTPGQRRPSHWRVLRLDWESPGYKLQSVPFRGSPAGATQYIPDPVNPIEPVTSWDCDISRGNGKGLHGVTQSPLVFPQPVRLRCGIIAASLSGNLQRMFPNLDDCSCILPEIPDSKVSPDLGDKTGIRLRIKELRFI